MSKANTIIILPAEEEGWEVWGGEERGLVQVASLSTLKAPTDSPAEHADLTGLDLSGASHLSLGLGFQNLVTIPFTIPSAEDEMVRNSAQLELENAGIADSGSDVHVDSQSESWDVLSVEQSENHTLATALQLLELGFELDEKFKKTTFDFSARYYLPPSGSDCIALWKEQGQWGVTFYRNKTPFFTEPIGDPMALPSVVRTYESQLAYKGIIFKPKEVFLWGEFERAFELSRLLQKQRLHLISELKSKPSPVLPDEALTIRPSVVVAWEEAAKQKGKTRALLYSIAAFYLIVLLFGAWVYWGADQKQAKLAQVVEDHSHQWEVNQQHFNDWEMLTPLATQNWPLALLQECAICLPSSAHIQLTLIDVNQSSIQLKGEAVNTAALNTFRKRLKLSRKLALYTWTMPPEKQSIKNQKWEFTYRAVLTEEGGAKP